MEVRASCEKSICVDLTFVNQTFLNLSLTYLISRQTYCSLQLGGNTKFESVSEIQWKFTEF